jgi:excisionase family DNA binding protein
LYFLGNLLGRLSKCYKIEVSMKGHLLTVEEAAVLKGISRSAVYTAVSEGRLPFRRVLGRIGLRQSDVVRWTPRSYRDRPGAKSGRPKGIPASTVTKQRISQAQKQRWALRQQLEAKQQ